MSPVIRNIKEFIVVLMVLRFAQNHKNNKFTFFIRKVNRYFELLECPITMIQATVIYYCQKAAIRNSVWPFELKEK